MGNKDLVASKLETVRGLLIKSKTQIQMALPKHLDADRMLRIVMTSVQRTPELLDCDTKSLLGAVIQSSQLGLEPDGVLGQAYIIPYRNEKKGIKEAQFQVGFKGLLELARRSGDIIAFCAHVVYENDKFEHEYGLNEKLVHVPTDGARGKLVKAYAIARFKDGGYAFEVMTREDIEKVKRSSKAVNSKFSPWQTWEEEMWRKTVAKKLCKYLPQSVELQRAAAVDEYIDMGIEDIPIGVEAATEDNKDALKEKIKAQTEANKKKTEKKGGKNQAPAATTKKAAPKAMSGQEEFEFDMEEYRIKLDNDDKYKAELLECGFESAEQVTDSDSQKHVKEYFKALTDEKAEEERGG